MTKTLIASTALMLGVVTSGCSTSDPTVRRGAAGAGIGALGGAAVGAITGVGVVEGAAVGAVAGGVVGAATAERKYYYDNEGRQYYLDEQDRRVYPR